LTGPLARPEGEAADPFGGHIGHIGHIGQADHLDQLADAATRHRLVCARASRWLRAAALRGEHAQVRARAARTAPRSPPTRNPSPPPAARRPPPHDPLHDIHPGHGRACALAGARNFREAGDHAADLPQGMLARLGGIPHPLRRRITAPSETRIRTLIQAIGADLLDDLAGGRLRALADASRLDEALTAIAIDGKWLRGVLDPGERGRHR
jgi:hypothetical protein